MLFASYNMHHNGMCTLCTARWIHRMWCDVPRCVCVCAVSLENCNKLSKLWDNPYYRQKSSFTFVQPLPLRVLFHTYIVRTTGSLGWVYVGSESERKHVRRTRTTILALHYCVCSEPMPSRYTFSVATRTHAHAKFESKYLISPTIHNIRTTNVS